MHLPQKQVKDFMLAMGQGAPESFRPLTPPLSTLRKTLILEEAVEFIDAVNLGDNEGALNGLVDLLYVIYGTFVAMGVDAEPGFQAVHNENMSKLWIDEELGLMPEGSVAKPAHTFSPAENAMRYVVTLDGKVIKPPSFKPINLLDVYGFREQKPSA